MHIFSRCGSILHGIKRKNPLLISNQHFHQNFVLFQNNWAKLSHSVLPKGNLDNEEQSHVERLFRGLIAGNRASLAQAITLVESTHSRKRLMARDLLTKSLDLTASDQQINKSQLLSFRIGLSGPPGAGKSTFLESMGMYLLNKGKKVAVLAVDPSSTTHGGSLLGDKTRMPELSRDLRAFVRPSPTGGHLGGVTRSTNEAILMCEAAGYDVIFVETVGVGQSEYAVADMVDLFVLLIPPAGGDELQGLKRGIMERSHIVVVNKADGNLVEAAMRMQYEYMSALKFMRPVSPHWRSQVVKVSSFTKEGLPELWKMMEEFQQIMIKNGALLDTRKKQRRVWMWNYITTHILQVFQNDPRVQRHIQELESQVEEGHVSAGEAAETLIHYFTSDVPSEC